jgi:signal transduction histidine kinase
VRQRLAFAVAAITALVLTGVGVTLYGVESGRIDEEADESLAHQLDHLETVRADGDLDTGQPYRTSDRLLEAFLAQSLAGHNEDLYGVASDGTTSVQGERNVELERSRRLWPLVDRLREAGGGVRDLTVGDRTYRVAVKPIAIDDTSAALVAVHDLSADREGLRALVLNYTALAVLAVLVVAALSSRIAGTLLRPVRNLRDTALQITEGDVSRRMTVSGTDDLADLQRTFNAMLDRLDAALTAQRRLLDDAGHELRTPLTVLRGHLEVLDPHDAQDVDETRRLLLDEIDRMTRLVEDLLVLARARRTDFVQPHPTDVAAVTHGVVARAKALGDRVWRVDSVADVTAELDEQRIVQALLQLTDNAVRHTSPGDEIGVGSALAGGHLDLWVRDTGPGVEPHLRDRLFERFSRGASDDDRFGLGLGLSIVEAIATAHGGAVVLDDTETGATVRLRLPVKEQQ